MARSRKARQWTGELAEPLVEDVETLMPKPYETPEEWLHRRARHVEQQRIAKLPELGRQLGMKVDEYDLTTPNGLTAFYQHLVLRLVLLQDFEA